MFYYISKKIFYSLVNCFIVAVFIFLSMRKFSDPASALLGPKSNFHQIQMLRKDLGLDKPLIKQLQTFLNNVFFKFDFGNSYIRRDLSAFSLFKPAFYMTLKISLISCFFASIIGISLAFISIFYKNSFKDRTIIFISIIIISIPSFIISFCVQYFLGFRLNLFPVSGTEQSFSLVLPIISLVLMTTFLIFRISRNSIDLFLKQPFVITARAKGLSEFDVLFKHVFKNAIIPIITNIGLILSFLLSGSIIVENIFNINGLGNLIINSFQNRDLPVIQCAVILLTLFISIFNIFLDFLCFFLDPTMQKNKNFD
ncbi:binding--dependent transport system inner membrane component family protein [Candidatus Phytoplasma oryzae]|uniref:Binding--dependent transport system inner membrane component family protein n=1 Tax=Candidatus Phytoplasma oryzae TaxID=203274 RepID=A0A139JQ18_9MOLU|nr:ABC transporter permease [Candidatus Phytoplasma oryzae]KXT29071.1 binding--dependent transport system inner membrane component family protein [Candidatus Phytoplasma oryzae]